MSQNRKNNKEMPEEQGGTKEKNEKRKLRSQKEQLKRELGLKRRPLSETIPWILVSYFPTMMI